MAYNKPRAMSQKGTGKNGNDYIRGYSSRKYAKFGFVASPYDTMKSGKHKNGAVWEAWICKIQPYDKRMPEKTCTLFFYPETGGFVIKDVGYKGNSNKRTFYPANWREIKNRMEQDGGRRYGGWSNSAKRSGYGARRFGRDGGGGGGGAWGGNGNGGYYPESRRY